MKRVLPGLLCALALVAAQASGARSAEDPCLKQNETPVQLKTSDGADVYGVEVGAGTTGVVLGHQFFSDHCELMGFARDLAQRGYRVLAIDFRGYGDSAGGVDGRLTATSQRPSPASAPTAPHGSSWSEPRWEARPCLLPGRGSHRAWTAS